MFTEGRPRGILAGPARVFPMERVMSRSRIPRIVSRGFPAFAILGVLLGGGGVALGQPAAGLEPVDLRPQWEAGQTSRYRITQTERTRDEIPQAGKSRQSSTELEVEATWRVLNAAEAGGGTAELVIDKLEMETIGPDGQSQPLTEPTQQWIDAMTGNPIEVEVGPDGGVQSVDGYQAIRQAAGPIGERLDEAYFREIVRDLALMYSGGVAEAEAGDEWPQSHRGSHQMGTLLYDTEYTLQGVQRIAGVPVAMVNRSSDVRFEPELPEDAQGSVDLRLTNASQSGQVMFDLSRHEVVGANVDQTLEFQITRSIRDRQLTVNRRETTSTQVLRIAEE